MAQPPLSPSWVLEASPLCGLSTPSSCSSALVAVGGSMGVIYPVQSAARGPSTSTLCEGSAEQGQGGQAPVWSVAVHWVHWPFSFPGGAGQGQPTPVLCPGHPAGAIKQSEMATTCAGLGDSQVKPSCDSNLGAARAD